MLDTMSSIDPALIAAYAIGFALLAFLPGWRSLLATALVLGILFGVPLLFYSLSGDDPTYDPGIGATLLLIKYYVFAIGLGVGFTSRAIGLALRLSGRRTFQVAGAQLAAFLFLPALMVGLSSLQKRSNRPPPAACLEMTFRIELAGAIYAVPAAPLFAVEPGLYSFRSNAGLRKFCALYTDETTVIDARSLFMQFEKMVASRQPAKLAFCRDPQATWSQQLCQTTLDPAASFFPVSAALYDPSEYNYVHQLGISGSTYQEFQTTRQKDAAAVGPGELSADGAFNRYLGGYWVARNGTWRTDTGEPYTLKCYETTPTGTLYCTTAYDLVGGSQVYYDFRAAATNLASTAMQVDRNLRQMLSELAVPD